ncbi:uncharacterized protein LOC123528201 [Mercenaria mercenaria]|uniref:uncharacterized protein LOC123528201 n=1 Tax=Mercenaria mercenaria TaxID=6596 RepID=UPI00234E66D6|nr:uncharacterized protein LOC123528201 [Mercenaria mercenaria]
MPAESGSTRKKQCDLPKPKTSKGTAAKSVQLGKRKYGASPSSGCEETLTATIIDATIQDFFKNTPTDTSTPTKTPEPACMLPKTPEPACVPPKTPEPACVPPKTPEPAETPGHYKRYQTPKYVETSSSDDDTDDDVVLTPLVNVPAVKVPRQLHKDASPCRREECINVKRELAQLREQVGSLEAKNRKLMRINKDLESKCETFNDSELHQQSSCEILDAINQLRPGVVTDRNAAREHKMVELVRGSYVFLYENQLKLANESSKSMSALARHLVDIFFSLDIQKTSNLSGSNGLKALDKTIVDAIVAYSVSCEQFKRQSPAEIRQSLRNKLGCLRAPSRTKD